MSELILEPQQWDLVRTETIQGGAWHCQVCGRRGERYMSLHAAQQAGVEHIWWEHQDLETITVSVPTEIEGQDV